MRQLEKAIHASRDSINLRMETLGVKPFIKYVLRPRASPRARPRRSNKSPVVGDWEPGDEVNYIASYEGAERELKRLHMYHGYRRYEELNLEIKPRVKT